MLNWTDSDHRQGVQPQRPDGQPAELAQQIEALAKLLGGWDRLVHQAGMFARQLDCGIVDAAVRSAQHARLTGQELPEATETLRRCDAMKAPEAGTPGDQRR